MMSDRSKRKATNKEVRERVLLTAQMIARRLHRHEIKRILLERHGIRHRQAAEYIARARAHLIERTNRPREDHIAEAFALYEGVIRSPEESTKEKMAAQQAIVELLGLAAPVKVAPTDPTGTGPVTVIHKIVEGLTTEELLVLSKIRQKSMAARASDQAASQN